MKLLKSPYYASVLLLSVNICIGDCNNDRCRQCKRLNLYSCFQPTPLYVMDEIDAALDFKNVSIVANYIKGTDQITQNKFSVYTFAHTRLSCEHLLITIF